MSERKPDNYWTVNIFLLLVGIFFVLCAIAAQLDKIVEAVKP